MDVEREVEMDAENGDVMDAKATDEMTNEKDAEIIETEKCVPLMTRAVPLHHLDSPRVRVMRTTSAESYSASTRRCLSADHVREIAQGQINPRRSML